MTSNSHSNASASKHQPIENLKHLLSAPLFFLHLRSKLGLGFLNFQQLFRIRSDELVFGIGSDNLDRRVVIACKKYPFANPPLEQPKNFPPRYPKTILLLFHNSIT